MHIKRASSEYRRHRSGINDSSFSPHRRFIEHAALANLIASSYELELRGAESVRLAWIRVIRKVARERPGDIQYLLKGQSCLLSKQPNVQVRDLFELLQMRVAGNLVTS